MQNCTEFMYLVVLVKLLCITCFLLRHQMMVRRCHLKTMQTHRKQVLVRTVQRK